MPFKFTVLGSSAALPNTSQISTALVVKYKNRYLLFDCAEGTQIKLRENKIPFSRIDHIYISHMHGDHYFGIFGLLTTLNLLGRKKALNIYAPKELKHHIDTVLEQNTLSYPLVFNSHPENKAAIITDNKSFSIKAFPLLHSIPAWGFVLKEKPCMLNIKKEVIEKYKLQNFEILKIKNGNDYTNDDGEIIRNEELTLPPYKIRALAICTDTFPIENIIKHIENADLLYHEATFLEKDIEIARKTMHSTAKRVAHIAKKANVKKLILGHISNRYHNRNIILEEAEKTFPNSALADAGTTFILPKKRHERHTNS